MKITTLTLLLALYLTIDKAQAQCDIGTTGIAVVNANNTASVSSGCVGQVFNFKFTIANFGSSPECVMRASSIKVAFDFPTISGGIKPYIYNGPATFSSGFFTWTYDSFSEELKGINTSDIHFGEGDANILVQVIGNAPGTASSPLNIFPGVNSNNTNNDFASAQLIINALPAVTWANTLTTQCINSTTYLLTGGSPSGGTYSGAGVTGNNFNAVEAGIGPHLLTYTFTNGSGCTGSATNTINVSALPVVSAGSYGPVCSNAAPLALGGSPSGGTWSGTGVTGINFNPSAGTQTLTYTYSNGTCSNSATTTITVNPAPVVSTGSYGPVCSNAALVTLTGSPSGGAWSGTGVTGNSFNPSAGTQTLTYTYSNGTCSNTASTTITVNDPPVVSFSGLAANYCTTDVSVTLTGSPAGGSFSGPGISGNTFNPTTAGQGISTIIYSFTNGSGCTSTSSQQVEVTVCATTIILNLKLFIQGYYLGGGTMQPVLNNQSVPLSTANETDSITVELHDPITFVLIDTKKVVLLTDGTTSATFSQPAGSYYIAIKHRSTIQTWTSDPVSCSISTPLYDFSTASNKAFADNMVQVEPGVWALYTGDLNQDDFIDGNDFPAFDTDSYNFVSGEYVNTDMNGDGFVDGNDFPVFDTNSYNFVAAAYPQ